VADRRKLDDPAAARRDRGAGGRSHQSLATVDGIAEKFRWRRPRHMLNGRQDPAEIERVGLRLQLRKQQAEAGDIVPLYGDESEALTHPYLARVWARSGADLRVPLLRIIEVFLAKLYLGPNGRGDSMAEALCCCCCPGWSGQSLTRG